MILATLKELIRKQRKRDDIKIAPLKQLHYADKALINQ